MIGMAPALDTRRPSHKSRGIPPIPHHERRVQCRRWYSMEPKHLPSERPGRPINASQPIGRDPPGLTPLVPRLNQTPSPLVFPSIGNLRFLALMAGDADLGADGSVG